MFVFVFESDNFPGKISLRSWRCCSLRSKRFCAVRDFFGSHPIFRAGKILKIPFFGLSSMLPNPMETLATQASSVGTILFAASPLDPFCSSKPQATQARKRLVCLVSWWFSYIKEAGGLSFIAIAISFFFLRLEAHRILVGLKKSVRSYEECPLQ